MAEESSATGNGEYNESLVTVDYEGQWLDSRLYTSVVLCKQWAKQWDYEIWRTVALTKAENRLNAARDNLEMALGQHDRIMNLPENL